MIILLIFSLSDIKFEMLAEGRSKLWPTVQNPKDSSFRSLMKKKIFIFKKLEPSICDN